MIERSWIRNLIRWIFLLLACVLISSCAALTRDPSDDVFDLVKVDSAAGCVTIGPFQACEGIKTIHQSIPWQIFDPTNNQRQQDVHAKLIGAMLWDGERTKRLPSSEQLVRQWHSVLALAIKSHQRKMFSSRMDANTQNLIASFRGINIPPAAKIDLQNRSIQIDRLLAQRWVAEVGARPELDGLCKRDEVPVSCKRMLGELLEDDGFASYVAEARKIVASPEGSRLIGMLVSYLTFQKQSMAWMSSATQRVYVVDEGRASPQIDILGNLYIPKALLPRLTSDQLEIVLVHEAAHVVSLEVDKLTAVLLEVQKSMEGKVPSSADSVFDKLMREIRTPHEMHVDLVAVEYFSLPPEKIALYAALLEELETISSARTEGLLALGELTTMSIHARDISQSVEYAVNVSCALGAARTLESFKPSSILLNETSRSSFERYRAASSLYAGEFAARKLVKFVDNPAAFDEKNFAIRVRDELLKRPTGCVQINAKTSDGDFSFVVATAIEKGIDP